jgi:hypothetical protein
MILLSSFSTLHIVGGMRYMLPLSLMALVNIAIFIFIVFSGIKKNPIHPNWLESIKQIGALAAAWGTWSTIAGLFQAFDALEASPEIIPFQVIMGGMKVAVITVLYGLLIFCVSMLAYIILKLTNKTAQV